MKLTNEDLKKIKTVLNLSENEFIELIESNDIIKIANDYESAYKDFVDFENGYDGTNLSYEEFLIELKKGYGKSNYVQIARLLELSNGIYYDNCYCG